MTDKGDNVQNIDNHDDPNKVDPLSTEFKRVVDEAGAIGGSLAQEGRLFTKEGVRLSDRANVLKNLNPEEIHPSQVENFIVDMTTSLRQAESALEGLSTMRLLVSSSTSSVDVTVTGSFSYKHLPTSAYDSNAIRVLKDYEAVIGGLDENKNDLEKIIESLKLNYTQAGNKLPIELLNEAYEAYAQRITDSDPVGTSLLTMRSCIYQIIDNLYKHIPLNNKIQSKGHGKHHAKVLLIGQKLSRYGVEQDQLETWARHWGEIHAELSSSKSAKMDRDEWRRILSRAIMFLYSILSGMDLEKRT